MNSNKNFRNRKNQKENKQEKNSSRYMKFFYALMLLLIASSSVIRFAGARRQSPQSVDTPAPESVPVGSGSTAARALAFRQEDSGTNACEDLTITSLGNTVYSNCGRGVEKQYILNETEQMQLNNWIGQFKQINYDHSDNAQNSTIATQLSLNGHGVILANDTETQQIIDFVKSLIAKIASQP
jgi:hypothetical protein